jgi:glycosyltransferase involved in cell wall biosynthesis
MRRGAFDLVYGNNTSSSTKNGLIAAKLARLPFIYHIRAMAGAGDWRRVAFLQLADATIAVSRATAQSYSRFLGKRMPYVVPNGVNILPDSTDRNAARQQLLRKLGMPLDAKVILSVGKVAQRKGTDYAVNTMARVVKEEPSAFLLIAGRLDREPRYTHSIRSRVADLGLEGRVLLLGNRGDVLSLMKGSDVLLHTATEDPHPRAVIEAMSCGLPVVAFGADGVAETVLHGQTGYLAEVGNVEALSTWMLEVVRDAGLRTRMSGHGRLLAAQQFSAEETARKVGDIIEIVVAKRHRSRGW